MPSYLRGATFRWSLAALSVAAWLPFLQRPLAADEAGFLLLGQQWAPGTSLYGGYWVDRPPLLIGLFSLAGHLAPIGESAGGPIDPAVKMFGALATGAAVVLAGWLAGLVAPGVPHRRTTAMMFAAALLCSPLLGMPEADGEVLAVPFVLLGLALLASSLREPSGSRAVLLAASSGAVGMCAPLIKQNAVDVFVFAVVAFACAWRRATGLRTRMLGFAAGAVVVLLTAVGAAASRGTQPAGLWNAVVMFRLHASEVIASSAPTSVPGRMAHLGLAAVASGAVLVVLVAAVTVVRSARRTPFGLAALAMAAWELFAVAAGGGYWLHYLSGLVPGVVVLVSVAGGRRGRILIVSCLAYAVVATLAAWTYVVVTPVPVSAHARVEAYLRGHARPSDGVVVAFGSPDIVAGSGLRSPYPELWALPVRVRDPRLGQLRRVLAGPDDPRWVVVEGDSLASWGLDARRTQRYLDRHYVEQVIYGDWRIWQRRGRGPR